MRRRVIFLLLLMLTIGICSMSGRGVMGTMNGTRTVTVDRGAQDPAVSPDGARVAVSVLGKIWIVPIAGGESRQLTEGLGWDKYPAWSPDGQFLAYAHQLPSGADLVVYNSATGNSSIIYHTNFALGQIAYHPRGGEIFFLLGPSDNSHLWRIPASGGEAKQLTFAEGWHEWSFALSPDGKQVLLDSGRYGGSDLYRIQLDGLQAMRLTRTPAHEFSVAWGKDGRDIGYIVSDNGVDTVMVEPANGGQARQIFSSPYDQKQLALHPDGKSAVLCAGRRLYRLDLASGNTTPIRFVARFARPELAKPDLVVTGARLFDGTGNEVSPNAMIEIRGGRIAAVRLGQSELPAGVPVLDAAGRMVMAGLMDNHYHYVNPFAGPTLLERGITTIRDPGGAISTSLNFKDANLLGLAPGPDIYACGPLIDGLGGYHPRVDVEIDKPEAAAPLVRSLKAQGVDGLKVYFMLKPEVLRAVIKEARAQGLPVTGHIGVRTSWREAMEAGITGLTHIRVWKDFLPPEKQPQGDDESLDADRNRIARMQADWSDIDVNGQGVENLLKMMRDHHIGFDPTLSIQRIRNDQRQRWSLDQFTIAQESYHRMAEFVARADRMGIKLLAGTDNGNLFDEMEAYADAGIPNADILRAATINGAEWLGKQADFGTIEAGKRANLIIVEGDPLKEMKDIRKIIVVIKDGRIVRK